MTPGTASPSAGGTIQGIWVRLAPVAAYPQASIDDLRFRLGLLPEMVAAGLEGSPAGSSRFGDASVIVDAETGELLGIIGNVEIGDYPGVAALVIYVDQDRSRAGYAMEAWYRYVQRIFALGATKVQMEVMAFNAPVHRIMRRLKARPEVVLREHFYIAGRHWDGTLYALDRDTWQVIEHRYRDMVQRPTAVASSRQQQILRLNKERSSMKVDYLVLADAAIAADGKHYLHGAGWDAVMARDFPAIHRHLSAALKVRVPGGEPTRRLTVDVVDPQGTSLLDRPVHADVGPDQDVAPAEGGALAMVFNFDGLRLAGPGTHAVVVSVEGTELARAAFEVRSAG